jgi:hypothetical protein
MTDPLNTHLGLEQESSESFQTFWSVGKLQSRNWTLSSQTSRYGVQLAPPVSPLTPHAWEVNQVHFPVRQSLTLNRRQDTCEQQNMAMGQLEYMNINVHRESA